MSTTIVALTFRFTACPRAFSIFLIALVRVFAPSLVNAYKHGNFRVWFVREMRFIASHNATSTAIIELAVSGFGPRRPFHFEPRDPSRLAAALSGALLSSRPPQSSHRVKIGKA